MLPTNHRSRGGRRRLRLPTAAHTAAAATGAASAGAQTQPVPQQQRRQDACPASLPRWQAVDALVIEFAARTHMASPPPWHPLHPGRHPSASSFSSNSGQGYRRGGGGANGKSAHHCTQRVGSQGSDSGRSYSRESASGHVVSPEQVSKGQGGCSHQQRATAESNRA